MLNCEILSVGTELLLGDTVDTNATFLSRVFREAGISVLNRQTCGDNPLRLRLAMELALSRSDLLVVSGGLGPTYDDITRETASEVFGMPLEKDARVEKEIRAFFARRGREMRENNLRQAMVPKGAHVLENRWGTAPGLWLEKEEKHMILLPGVPHEMKAIVKDSVLPRLREMSGLTLQTRVLHFYGISESELDEKLSDLMQQGINPSVAPFAGSGEVEIHITASGKNREEVFELCRKKGEEVLSRVGAFCYGEGETNLEQTLVKRFVENGITVATAESCTGGLLSQRITSVPGASSVFSLGICSYSEEVKMRELGVSAETLSEHGVYSLACACEMAEGIRKKAQSRIGIGITGIAGPDGGSDTDPVGTVYLAVATENQVKGKRVVLGHTASSREEIRSLAASCALATALEITGLFSLKA